MGGSWTVIHREDTSDAGDDVFDMTLHLLQLGGGSESRNEIRSDRNIRQDHTILIANTAHCIPGKHQ